MPKWMEPYRKHICNTGGNSIEDCMNGDADPVINLPLSTIQFGVKSQVGLLYALHKAGVLRIHSALPLHGFAMAIGSLVRDYDGAAQAGAIMRDHGITLAQMIE